MSEKRQTITRVDGVQQRYVAVDEVTPSTRDDAPVNEPGMKIPVSRVSRRLAAATRLLNAEPTETAPEWAAPAIAAVEHDMNPDTVRGLRNAVDSAIRDAEAEQRYRGQDHHDEGYCYKTTITRETPTGRRRQVIARVDADGEVKVNTGDTKPTYTRGVDGSWTRQEWTSPDPTPVTKPPAAIAEAADTAAHQARDWQKLARLRSIAYTLHQATKGFATVDPAVWQRWTTQSIARLREQ